ncbi:lipopolysaccharide biosynthesis protein [Eubacterium limosum]|uniref:lipopolysaccharide biosynthesis protein n=1 Tax=Eubacterium limosum TaxID=1736 RepID=UPI00106439D0|nr:oligosaccharide flippase family protein [Eubacterium limosum]
MTDPTKINYGKKTIYINSVLSVIYKFVGMGCSLISAPLLLQCLGDEKYGVWVSLLSIISWIYYFDLGIGNGLRNRLTTSIAMNDIETSKKYLCISYILLSTISIVMFTVVYVFISRLDFGQALNIHLNDESINRILIVAVLLACLNFVVSLVNNVLYALQKSSAVGFFNIIGQILFIMGLVIYKLFNIKVLLLFAIAEGGAQLLKNLIESIYVYGKNPILRFSLKDLDFKYANGILSFGLQMFIVQIAALILNSTDNLIIIKYFGATAVTPYSMCYKYFNIINTVFVAIVTPLLSAYTAAYAKKDIKWIKTTLKKSLALYGIFFIGIIVAAFIFKPFASIWLHKQLDYPNGLILLTAIYFALLIFMHIFSTFLTGLGMIKETTIANVIQAIINIPVSIILSTKCGFGINGVILGSIASMLVVLIVAPIKSVHVMKKLTEDRNQ